MGDAALAGVAGGAEEGGAVAPVDAAADAGEGAPSGLAAGSIVVDGALWVGLLARLAGGGDGLGVRFLTGGA